MSIIAISQKLENVTVLSSLKVRILSFLFAFCMFTTGASGLVNEYALAAVSTFILGNSIEQFGITMGLMMLMMGIGGVFQEKIKDTKLVQSFMTVEVLMALFGGFAPIAIYSTYALMEDHFLLIHYFFVISIGFLIGFEIPLVMRIIDSHGVKLKVNLKLVYAADYIGAFVGAILWVKVLLKNFPITEISFIVASLNFLVAFITISYFIYLKLINKSYATFFILAITAFLLFFGYLNNRDWNLSLEQKMYDNPIIYSKTTKYQRLVMTYDKKIDDYRLYINGSTQFSSIDEARYHEFLVHTPFLLNPNARNILVLGGGDGLALREILKYKGVKSVTLVDLDPDMVKFSSTNEIMRKLNKDAFLDARVFSKLPTGLIDDGVIGIYQETGKTLENGVAETEHIAQVQVFNLDADMFVANFQGQTWDTVIIDFPDPNGVELSKLYSKEFFLKLRRHLTHNASISIQSTSPYHSKEAYLCIKRTIEAAGYNTLPYHYNIPSFGDWGWILAWTNGMSKYRVKNKIMHTFDFKVETSFLTPDVLKSSFSFGKGELDSKYSKINTVMEPVLLDYYLNDGWQVE